MTTIAYKDGVIAYDSLETQGSHICDKDCNKHTVEQGIHFFMSGAACDEHALIDCFVNGRDGEGKELNCSAVAYDGEDIWECGFSSDDGFWKVRRKPELKLSIGSGSDYAFGAMDAGLSAKEAVKIAAGRDTGTGGRIRTFKIRK